MTTIEDVDLQGPWRMQLALTWINDWLVMRDDALSPMQRVPAWEWEYRFKEVGLFGAAFEYSPEFLPSGRMVARRQKETLSLPGSLEIPPGPFYRFGLEEHSHHWTWTDDIHAAAQYAFIRDARGELWQSSGPAQLFGRIDVKMSSDFATFRGYTEWIMKPADVKRLDRKDYKPR